LEFKKLLLSYTGPTIDWNSRQGLITAFFWVNQDLYKKIRDDKSLIFI